MPYSVHEIATALGLKAEGNLDLVVEGAAEPSDAQACDIALAMKPEFAKALPEGGARVAVLWDGADWQELGLEAAILAPRPRYAMSGLTAMMDPGEGWAKGIHPSAVIDPSAVLGDGVCIGPLTVIGPRARIGAGSVIGPQSYVGSDAVLGENSLLRESARLASRVVAGDRLILQPGATVGGDGFSYVTPETSGIENVRDSLGDQGDAAAQSYTRIHSLGSVQLGDDVEIGANATVDRGTIRNTVVGNGTKIDNLVQVGHNCVIGNDCLLCGLAGLAGSVTVGNNVVLAGQTGAADNIFIGDNVIAGGASKIFTNVPAGRVILGSPAVKMETQIEINKGLRRLKRLFADVAELKKTVSKDQASD